MVLISKELNKDSIYFIIEINYLSIDWQIVKLVLQIYFKLDLWKSRGAVMAQWSRSLLHGTGGLYKSQSRQQKFSIFSFKFVTLHLPTHQDQDRPNTRRIRSINAALFCTQIYGMGPTINIYIGHFQSKRWLIHITYKRRRKEDMPHPPPL